MTIRNPIYSNAARTSVDIEFDHPRYGWIPVTVNAEEYPELWDQLSRMPVAEYQAPDPSIVLQGWRDQAELARSDFCVALKRFGILSAEEAISAAQGNWPASFAPLLESMTEDEASEARIMWASIRTIRRMHPLFESVRQYFQMSPEQADVLFGYQEAPLD